jgi:uncharacterized membrane protein YhaH (DUF805 family)
VYFWAGSRVPMFLGLAGLCFLQIYSNTLHRQADFFKKRGAAMTGAQYLGRALWRITWETIVWIILGFALGMMDGGNPRLLAAIVVFALIGYPLALLMIAYLWAKKIPHFKKTENVGNDKGHVLSVAPPSLNKDAYWFYALGSEKKGPVSEHQVAALIKDSGLTPASMVWTKGMESWKPASETSLLSYFSVLNPVSSPAPTTQTSPVSPTPSVVPSGKLTFWEHTLTPMGRLGRGSFFLRNILTVFALALSAAAAESIVGIDSDEYTILAIISVAFFGYISVLNWMKRLHDLGDAGWLAFMIFLPIVNAVIGLVLLLRMGDQGPNKYGPPYNGL